MQQYTAHVFSGGQRILPSYHSRFQRRDVCVSASGNRKKKKKQQKKSGLDVSIEDILPSSKEEAIQQGSRGLVSCLKSLKSPKGVMDDSEDRLWVQVDVPVMGQDVVEDSVALARELLAAVGGNKSGIYVVPDSSRIGQQDVVTYSTMMSPEARVTYDYCFVVAPKKADVGLVESIVLGVPQNTPVVLINPEWSACLGDADGGVGLQYTDFVQCFATAYCFFPILIKPFMMKQIEGVVYSDSSAAKQQTGGMNKPWKIFMQQKDSTYQLVGQMKTRPSSGDVESILYNAIAVNNSTSGNENPFKKLFGKS